MVRFQRFVDYLSDHPEACEVAARLRREGTDLHRVFAALMVYVEGRSIAKERKKRGKTLRGIVNRGVRDHGVSPEVGRWLLDRAELAHATDGLGLVHNLDSLAWSHIYLELVTGRRVTMGELAYLVQGANHALGRQPKGQPSYVDPNAIGHELRRYRQKNPRFIQMLRADISRNL
jgi:hypothetical protein